ncbi:MAG: DUF1295 domain-containing protein [Gammaproteobacteria bacterium]|nr:DUF1295 domain-containing protein [Gammaproteobacteria bacterium]
MLDLGTTAAVYAFLTPFVVFGLLVLLHVTLPALKVEGYVRNEQTGELLNYRLNGLLVFAVALGVWWFEVGGIPRDWLFRATFYSVAGSTVLAFLITLVLMLGVRDKGRNGLRKFWNGWELNPKLGNRVDVKMVLYIFGGTLLSLNALSGAAYHAGLYGESFNLGVLVYAGMWTFFVIDYFSFERVQLYTYDIIHETLGFKLIWGCLVVYAYLYLIPLWGLSHFPAPGFLEGGSLYYLGGICLLFLIGWVISRGSNWQKYTFKRWPDRKFLGFIAPRTLGSGEAKILCSGFWGASRHMNYFGEFLMALAMALAFGHFLNVWAWIYVVFIVGLFIHRQRTDDQFCAKKYGEAWAQYCKKTPKRIIPGIY